MESENVLRLTVVEKGVKEVSEHLKDAGKSLEELRAKFGDGTPEIEEIAKSLTGVRKATEGLVGATKGVGSAGETWEELSKRVRDASEAYREMVREAVAAGNAVQDVHAFMSGAGVSDDDLRNYRRGSNASLSADDTAKHLADQAAREAAERARILAIRRQEDNLINDYLAGQKEGLAEKERLEVERTLKLRREQTNIYNDYLASQKEGLTAQREAARLAKQQADENDRLLGRGMSTADRGVSAATKYQEDSSYRNKVAANKTAFAEFDQQMREVEEGARRTAAATGILASDNLPRLRYALYDVATTAGIASAALTAVGVAITAASASQESAFTNVERTMEPGIMAAGDLRAELMALTREMPKSFSEIAEIATLGNQLGVEAQNIEAFTGTVARFSSVAGVSAEATAKAFGSMTEILDVAESDYEKLGSAIALVGRRSVATEDEILSLTREIGQQAHSAGFTAQEVVGLAGALGELRVPPERSRGALTTYFQTLNQAVAEGGDRLEAFARVIGTSSQNLEQMVRAEDGVQIFQRFLTSLQDLDNVDAAKALDELGLAQLRVSDVFQRLGSNVDVFNQNLASGAQGWEEGTELARQYGMVVDDLASKWQLFTNAIAELAGAAGDVIAPFAKTVVDMATGLIQFLTKATQTPFGQWMVGIAAGAGALAAALLGIVSTGALAVASIAALRTAVQGLGWGAATTGVRGFAAGMVGASTATGGAATALKVFKGALISTGIGAAVVLLGSLAQAFMDTGNAAEEAFDKYIGTSAGLADAVAADTAARNQAIAEGNFEVADSYQRVIPFIDENTEATKENSTGAENAASILGLIPTAYDGVNKALYQNTQYLGKNTIAWAKNQLFQNEEFKKLAENPDFTKYMLTIGADFEEIIRRSASGGEEAVIEYFRRQEAAAIKGGKKVESAFNGIGDLLGNGSLKRGWFGGDAFHMGNSVFGSAIGRSVSDVTNLSVGLTNALSLLGVGTDNASSSWENFDNVLDTTGDGIEDVGGSVEDLEEKVRTLVDYAGDLSSVMSRAFDIRYGSQSELDGITQKWNAIADATQKNRDAIRDAERAIRDYKAEINELNADKNIKKYWLSVAEMYGDEKRAAALRADIAGIDSKIAGQNDKIADSKKKISEAQDANSKSLIGNTKSAIENRDTITSLVSSYQDYITKLAESGMSQDELKRKVGQLREDFIKQATQMGYNRGEVDLYARSFGDMRTAIDKIPRDITVRANADPALQALAEFEARAKETSRNVRDALGNAGTKGAEDFKDNMNRILGSYEMPYGDLLLDTGPLNGGYGFGSRSRPGGGFATGGYTGGGGASDIAGVVHKREFVFNAPATTNLGTGFLNSLHQAAQSPAKLASLLGGNRGSSGPVELGAATIQAIASAVQPYLFMDGKLVAQSSSRAFANSTALGGA